MSSGSDLEDITNWKLTCVQLHFVCKIYVKMGVVWNFDNSNSKINFSKKKSVSSPKYQYGFNLDNFRLVADVKMMLFLSFEGHMTKILQTKQFDSTKIFWECRMWLNREMSSLENFKV